MMPPLLNPDDRDPAGLYVEGAGIRSDMPECMLIYVSRVPTIGEMEAICLVLEGRDWRVEEKGKGDD